MAVQPNNVNIGALQAANNAQNHAQVTQHLKTSISDNDVKAFIAKQIANQIASQFGSTALQQAAGMNTSQLLQYIRQNIL